jgi:thiamine biosynthesis lipoprotein
MPLEPAAGGAAALDLEALGSSCHLFAVGAGDRALDQAASWVEAMHHRLSRFEPGSELSAFNARSGGWVEVSPPLEELLRQALRAYEVSSGLVHAGVLPSLLAAGYVRTLSEGVAAPHPDAFQVPAPLPELLQVRRGRARLRHGALIDLGGIAKGWMADRLAESLGDNALVNLGGDLYARGGGPEGKGWPVGMGGVTVLLRDCGAATSATRRRRWVSSGQSYHHLIDPRTGRPALGDLEEVSVLAPTATDGEILAKAALLLGSVRAPAFLRGRATGWWLA